MLDKYKLLNMSSSENKDIIIIIIIIIIMGSNIHLIDCSQKTVICVEGISFT